MVLWPCLQISKRPPKIKLFSSNNIKPQNSHRNAKASNTQVKSQCLAPREGHQFAEKQRSREAAPSEETGLPTATSPNPTGAGASRGPGAL